MIDEAYEKTVMKYCEGYPKELLEYPNDELIGFSLNGAILDLANSRIIKLSSTNQVMRGYYGFQEMSKTELEEIYGKSLYFEFDIMKYRNFPHYMAFHTYFDSAILVMVAKILDLIRRGLLKKTIE